MDIIVDASIIIAVICGEPEKEQILQLSSNSNAMAPYSIHWEVGNAFSAMLKRGRVSLERVLEALQSYSSIRINYKDIDLAKALELANKHNIYAYDAYLIQTAKQYKLPLMTLDNNLCRCAEKEDINLIKVKL